MTDVVSKQHLQLENLRNIPKSRIPVSLNFLRLKIIKHQVYVSALKIKNIEGRIVLLGVPPTYLSFVSLFLNVLINTRYGEIPDTEFLINTAACGTDLNPGVMTHSRVGGISLLPSDYEAMCTNGGNYPDYSKSGAWVAIQQIPLLPWKDKVSKAAWRGSCTGSKSEYFKNNSLRIARNGRYIH